MYKLSFDTKRTKLEKSWLCSLTLLPVAPLNNCLLLYTNRQSSPFHVFQARFKRRILHAPNAIQTMHNEEAYLIIYCLNCIRCMQNSTFETGLIGGELEPISGGETMHYSPLNNKKITCAITRTRDLWTAKTRECFVYDIVYRMKFNVF